LEKIEQRHQKQRDDDPQGEIAKIIQFGLVFPPRVKIEP
jgi:hypothetical protein